MLQQTPKGRKAYGQPPPEDTEKNRSIHKRQREGGREGVGGGRGMGRESGEREGDLFRACGKQY